MAQSATPSPSGVSISDEALWRAAIGKRSDYYLPCFAKYDQGGKSFPSWHWPAFFTALFFVASLWALYRKIWGGAVLFFLIPILVLAPLLFVAEILAPGNQAARSAANWFGAVLAWVLPATLANGLCYRRIKARVQKARTRYADTTAQVAYLTAQGATSSAAAAVAIIPFVTVVVVGILAAIALPAYEDYVTRAKVSEALTALEPLKLRIELGWNENNTFPRDLDLRAMRSVLGARYVEDVRFDSDNGIITVVFGGFDQRLNLNGKSIQWVASLEVGQPMHWACRNVDAPPRFLRSDCRN
jgi:hypothetical protein